MAKTDRSQRVQSLLRLSHELGRADRPLAILAEGNTSVRINADSFMVKASGRNLATLSKRDVVECRTSALLAMVDRTRMGDAEIETGLMAARLDAQAPKPSVEALFHACLLSLPGVEYVGHTHAPAVNSILCSPRAREFAEKRLYPDEVVCCDVASVFLPYTDPGLKLAQVLRRACRKFFDRHARPPRVILMENHGLITLGRSVEAVLSAMLMAEKAATIWLGAAILGGPKFMTPAQVARIAGRMDEKKRRRALNL